VVVPAFQYAGSRALENIGLEHIKARSPWIQCHLYPVKSQGGEVRFVVNTYMDITQQKDNQHRLEEYQARLRALASELTTVEERERRRIAADLHDQVGQALALSRVRLASASKSATAQTLRATLAEISQTLLHAAQATRHLTFDLSSPSMNEIGLAAAISEWLQEQVQKRHGLDTHFEDCGHKFPLSDDLRAVLFRNVRELLTNTVKHAQATRVSVAIEDAGTHAKIIVADDGVGFTRPSPEQASRADRGFGLFSIQERMTDLGGSFEITSEPGKGTVATLIVPLDRG